MMETCQNKEMELRLSLAMSKIPCAISGPQVSPVPPLVYLLILLLPLPLQLSCDFWKEL